MKKIKAEKQIQRILQKLEVETNCIVTDIGLEKSSDITSISGSVILGKKSIHITLTSNPGDNWE